MKKQEAINYIRKKMGFVPYVGLFDIYSDDDNIPQELIDVECNKSMNSKENGNFIICNEVLANVLNNL